MSIGVERDETRKARARVYGVTVLVLFAVAVIRLFDLQIVHGAEHRGNAENNRFRKEVLRAQRGRIVDREGRVLVDNFASFVLTLNPYDPELRRGGALGDVLARVATLIDRDPARLERVVASSRRKTFLPVRLKRNLSQSEVARIEEAAADLPGIRIRVEPSRRYIHGPVASHLLGYVGEMNASEAAQFVPRGYEPDDQIGKAALEERYEDELHGRHGERYVEVDAFGRARTFTSARARESPERGQDLVLTIDLVLQQALESALDSVAVSGGHGSGEVVGAAVALDVWTGEIYAMASRPAFDPNAFAVGLDEQSWVSLRDNPNKPLLNRSVQSTYPPGSVFKMIVATAALDSGLVTPKTKLDPCFGAMRYGNRNFRCWRAWGHGQLDMTGALEQSCDVYFYQLGDMLGVDGIARYARRFGIGFRTGIDLPGEARGLIADSRYLTQRYGRRGWSRGAALNLAIGQGELLFTPMELAVYTATLANGGDRVVPHLVRETTGRDGRRRTIPSPERIPAVHDLSPLLSRMRGMMGLVVDGEDGTGGAARVPGLPVAGKTGTSQNPHGEDHALFISFAPADAPHLALVVVLEERGHGGAVAAPVAGRFWRAYQAWRSAQGSWDIG